MPTLREQFIERLIREFFLNKGSGFVLKGGAAMRTLYGEQRLTKDVDLDFTNPKRTPEALHGAVKRAIAGAARGLPLRDLTISHPGKAELSPRWKINFRDSHGERFHVEVEVSRDPSRAAPGTVVQKRFSPEAAKGLGLYWVDIYDEPALIATKLAALLGREAPRDIYDLDLLIAAGRLPSAEQVQWVVKRAGLKDQELLQTIADRLQALSWDRFVSDLRDSLPAHIADRMDEGEWSAMKARVAGYAERLFASSPRAEP
jgi:predicted nucleotidyltransferase component of viral defense system